LNFKKHYSILIIFLLTFGCKPQQPGNIADVQAHEQPKNWKIQYNLAIDSLINQAVIDSIVPGAVALVSIENQIVYKNTFGYAHAYDYGKKTLQNPEEMTSEHVFDLASLTKVLATTMGIMKLVGDGRINLDDKISRYLTPFKATDKEPITIRHLLTHTSGLQPWKPLYFHADNSAKTLDYIATLPLSYSIGKERHYSDLGFMLLGYIIEGVSGTRLDDFLNSNIYSELDLKNTSFNPTLAHNNWPYAATSHGNPFEYKMVADDDFGYDCDEDISDFKTWRTYTLKGEVNDGNAFYANDGIAGHAGLFSTVDDIQKLLQLLLNNGYHKEKRILSTEVVREFLTRDIFDNGLGWAMSTAVLPVTELPDGAFGHTGFTGTYLLCLPDRALSLVLLTNRQNLDVSESGSYNSLTSLRKNVSDFVIRKTE
jgi:CubicO group peptidase (beta-lactamase class C family)